MRSLFLGCAALALAVTTLTAIAQEVPKRRTGTLTGEVKSLKPTPNGKNVIAEVLGAGEEKARPYRVQYDPAIKAPVAKVLEVVRSSKVGDRVQMEWIDTGEGLAITKFEILKRAAP